MENRASKVKRVTRVCRVFRESKVKKENLEMTVLELLRFRKLTQTV
jgi:hypothetical protein